MMLRRDAPNQDELRKHDRERYQNNRAHILQRRRELYAEKWEKSASGRLVEHHIKYKEIHGVDETVWIPFGEHIQIHRRLRKEGKCNIPVKELGIISHRAKCRTSKYRERRQTILFTETIMEHVQLIEEISYDMLSGHVYSRGRFRPNDRKQLYYIDIWIIFRRRGNARLNDVLHS